MPPCSSCFSEYCGQGGSLLRKGKKERNQLCKQAHHWWMLPVPTAYKTWVREVELHPPERRNVVNVIWNGRGGEGRGRGGVQGDGSMDTSAVGGRGRLSWRVHGFAPYWWEWSHRQAPPLPEARPLQSAVPGWEKSPPPPPQKFCCRRFLASMASRIGCLLAV